jgi:hypothetical protein
MIVSTRSYLDDIPLGILLYAAAEIFVSAAVERTFNFYRVVHSCKRLIERCNYLPIIAPRCGVRRDIIRGKMLRRLQSRKNLSR